MMETVACEKNKNSGMALAGVCLGGAIWPWQESEGLVKYICNCCHVLMLTTYS